MTYQKLELFYSYNYYDLIVTILLLIISLGIANFLTLKFKINNTISILMYTIHHLYFLVYFYYSIDYGLDSTSYFLEYKGYEYLNYEPGQVLLYKFIGLLNSLNIDYLNINYLFSILSLISFYYLLYILKLSCYKQQIYFKFVLLLIFLPSIHFWIMGYSKDTITFFCISVVFYEFVKKKQNFLIIFIMIFLISLIRLHISLMIILSISIVHILNSKNYKNTLFVALLTFLFLILSLKNIISETPTIENIKSFLNMFRNLYVSNENTAILTNNFFYKIYYYLFVPNLFTIRGNDLFFLVITIENTYLVLLFLYLILKKNFNFKVFKKNLFFLFFGLISLTLFTFITSNLGIAARQKWFIVISLIIFLLLIKGKIFKKIEMN